MTVRVVNTVGNGWLVRNGWCSVPTNGTVVHFDTSTGSVLGIVTIGGEPRGVVLLNGLAWVCERAGGRLVAVDQTTHAIVHDIPGFISPHGLTTDGASLLLTENGQTGGEHGVKKINPVTLAVTGFVSLGIYPWVLGYDGQGRVWVPDMQGAPISIVDVASMSIVGTKTTGIETWGCSLSGDGAKMNAAGYGGDVILQYPMNLAASGNQIALPAGSGVADIQPWNDRLLVCMSLLNQLGIYDANTGANLGEFNTGMHPASVCATATDWWVVASQIQSCQRLRGVDT